MISYFLVGDWRACVRGQRRNLSISLYSRNRNFFCARLLLHVIGVIYCHVVLRILRRLFTSAGAAAATLRNENVHFKGMGRRGPEMTEIIILIPLCELIRFDLLVRSIEMYRIADGRVSKFPHPCQLSPVAVWRKISRYWSVWLRCSTTILCLQSCGLLLFVAAVYINCSPFISMGELLKCKTSARQRAIEQIIIYMHVNK